VAPIPDERTKVELPLIEQLEAMGWQRIEGDVDVPELTERRSFREVLLFERLRAAIRRINVDADGLPWLDDSRVHQAVGALERLGAYQLLEANQVATGLLLQGTEVEGDPDRHGGKEQPVRFVDFQHTERSDFLVIDQFRVDGPAGQRTIVPDVVLFVNGIPLVVIECKSPAATDPMEAGITQLLRYSNQREWVEGDEGAEPLFHYNQLLVSTYFYESRVGVVGASYEHYLEWKDTSPVLLTRVWAELGVETLSSQQILVAGMLRPDHMLDLVRNFTLFTRAEGKNTKIVGRYQQFRAVHEAIRRLQKGQTRLQHGFTDQRGGIIWHTQGSGKSLTMVFLVRKLRTLPVLRRFKIVVITDRTDLEKQLGDTALLTGETVHRARSAADLQERLREDGPALVFALIQKYHAPDDDAEVIELSPRTASTASAQRVAEPAGDYRSGGDVLRLADAESTFPVLNESEEILVLVDEAHRSHTNTMHANLLKALPNCARIGFTGTPILMGDRKRTQEIFGDFIDRYTIQQSEDDGATVPILYEGRTTEGVVADGRSLDHLFEDMFQERTPEELEVIKRKYATEGDVLEAPRLIAAKARDMLRHYVETVLPNGLKAQVVAVSRLAAVRYQRALVESRDEITRQLEAMDAALLTLSDDELQRRGREVGFLVRAHPHLETIRRLEFAAVISGNHNDDPAWRTWSDPGTTEARIERFKKPLSTPDGGAGDPLAFLCVKSMLLTGFDAPAEQALYLDRFMQGHELLQAIARVNRPHANKSHGLVVDYYGVARHLKEALAAYSAADLQGAMLRLDDELPTLELRHRRALAVFQIRGIPDIAAVDACVDLLRDVKVRADFVVKLKQFLESLDVVLPRPEALPYLRHAKLLGYINKAAANLYRDSQLNLAGAEPKVRRLIDEYVLARGIDPKIPPVSIMAADFNRAVDSHASTRAKASEMEFAARHHISAHLHEDPIYYRKLSERLEAILQQFEQNWEELVAALRDFTQEVREGRPADQTGLDPRTQAPFLGILVDAAVGRRPLSSERLAELARLTVELVEHIRQEIRLVDFWRNTYGQNVLRGWVLQFLDEHDLAPFQRQQAIADELVDLAKALHTRLVP